MKPKAIYCCIISILMVTCNANNDRQEDAYNNCQLHENGYWVDIMAAPANCGFILHDNRVYGVAINVSPDTIDWDEFWEEFLRSKYDTVYIRNNGEIVDFMIEDNTVRPLSHIDIETMVICINSDGEFYAKDRNNVYYPTSLDVFDYNGYYDLTFEGDIRIPDADPASFKYLGKGYAIDKNFMYHNGKKIKWNDHIITALQSEDCPEILPVNYGMQETIK